MMRRLLASTAAAAVIVAALATASLAADDPRSVVGEVALAYARGFDGLLAAQPEEAERLGVDRATLAQVAVTGVHKVQGLDPDFAIEGERRSIDTAVVETDLWWVVLSDRTGRARLQVSVRWPAGAASPAAVGLNWAGASDIASAFKRGGDPDATLVWVPADLPVFISRSSGRSSVTPIASAEDRAVFGVEAGPTQAETYSTGLHKRLDALPRVSLEPGAGGGAPVPGSQAAADGVAPPAGVQVGLVAALLFVLLVGLPVASQTRARPNRM